MKLSPKPNQYDIIYYVQTRKPIRSVRKHEPIHTKINPEADLELGNPTQERNARSIDNNQICMLSYHNDRFCLLLSALTHSHEHEPNPHQDEARIRSQICGTYTILYTTMPRA